MPRIAPIEHDNASAKAGELLDEYAARAGKPGPMVRTMAQAPAVLRGYLDLNRAMSAATSTAAYRAHRARRAGMDRL